MEHLTEWPGNALVPKPGRLRALALLAWLEAILIEVRIR